MKWNSIQTKVLAALVACLVLGVGGILALMQYSFARNSQALALDSVSGSQKLFAILENREISKMIAVSDGLIMNVQIRDAFAAKDRPRLLALAAPLYPQLKSEGITNWMFHTPEPDMAVFLRLHNPAKFGDHLNRIMDTEIVRTHAIVTGNELAKAGFAERIIRPVYDSQGKVTGYVEFGEELGQFIHAMKGQTGDDYGLLLSKKFVDRQFWADSSATLKRRDNWNDNPSFVVADKTTAGDDILRFNGDLAAVPDEGTVLERYRNGNSVFIRGIFPIHDVAGRTVGAMFVVRDISAVYLEMRRTQIVLVLVIVVSLLLGMTLVLILLHRLVFKRLHRIIRVATRVVGGDFESAISVTSDDEVGQLEQLFEQFRQVFVDILAQFTVLQEKQ
jgi:HAMP domain-containing protein